MSYETRAYDDPDGNPVAVLVVRGTHDVSRLVSLLNGAPVLVEQMLVGERLTAQVRRHNGGRNAFALLKAHGGPDFSLDGPETLWWVTDGEYDVPDLHPTADAARHAAIERYVRDNPDRDGASFAWERESPDIAGSSDQELVADGRRTGWIVAPVTIRTGAPEPQEAGAQ